MKRFLLVLLVATATMMWRTVPAKAQLGNLDNCETFYRLAKAHVWWFDASLSAVQLAEFQHAYGFDPQLSSAYSALFVACNARQGGVR